MEMKTNIEITDLHHKHINRCFALAGRLPIAGIRVVYFGASDRGLFQGDQLQLS